jgi:hypothetical protein
MYYFLANRKIAYFCLQVPVGKWNPWMNFEPPYFIMGLKPAALSALPYIEEKQVAK